MPHWLHWPRALRVLRARPRLLISIAVGIAITLALPSDWVHASLTRLLIGWNACTLLYLGLAAHMAARSDIERIRRRALVQSEGRFLVLGLAVASSVAVIIAIGSQLAVVKDMHGSSKVLHIGLVALTLASAWLFTQTLFALHYAHDFYLARARHHGNVLLFPGTEHPDYGDFLYFSCVIGTSGQTADISFADSTLRRIGLVHCVLAFFFNTTVLALTINIGASLF